MVLMELIERYRRYAWIAFKRRFLLKDRFREK